MRVWRKQTVRYTKNGKRCSKSTKGAKPKTEESKRWYGTLRLANGKRKQIPLTEDMKTSETLLRRLQGDEDRKNALGITEADEKRTRSVLDALDGYLDHLRQKGNTDEHVKTTEQRLRKLFTATKTKVLDDLDESRVLKTVDGWRKAGTIGVKTMNHYIGYVKSFSKWLLRERQLKDDPFIGLRRQNAKTDRRRVRRAFTDDELKRLLTDTQQSTKRYRGSDWQFLPADRVMLYTLAASTGLRAKELSTLTVDDFDFSTKTLTVDASNTKNRQRAILPLTDHVCEAVKAWLPIRGGLAMDRETDRLFPGCWNKQRMAGKILKRDLKRSGIPNVDGQGKTLDFHSLRYTFVSNLARGGVHPAKAQRLARHSDINLTMSVYTSLSLDELRDAVDVLPRFG